MSARQSVVAAVAVAAAAAALAVVGSERPTVVGLTARAVEQPIRSATLACPGDPGNSTAPTSVFAVGPGGGAGGPAGRLAIVAGGPGGATLGSSPAPGRSLRVAIDEDAGRRGLLVQAAGTQAPGVAGAQLSMYRSATEHGLAATWCESPRDEWWFNGVDTGVGTSTRLVLANPSRAVAVVDLRFLGARGAVDAAGGNGIAVGPRSRLVLDLARYAPGQAALTLHVTATRGTVGAALTTTRLEGVTPVGADWVPASTPPAKTVVVNAGVGGVGRQLLVVTNPGSRQRLVSFRVLAQTGAYASTDLPDLQVAPGSVEVLDISAILDKQTTAIELSAAGPVTGALVSRQSGRARDFAVSGVGAPLTGPTVAPGVKGTSMALSFATPDPGQQRVQVRGFAGDGETAGTATVLVTGSATTSWKPPVGWGAAYLVVSPPTGSALHVVVSYVGATGVAQLPLLAPPRTVLRPAVLPL